MEENDDYVMTMYAEFLLKQCFHCRETGIRVPPYDHTHPVTQAINLLVCKGWVTETPNDDIYYITDEGMAEILTRDL